MPSDPCCLSRPGQMPLTLHQPQVKVLVHNHSHPAPAYPPLQPAAATHHMPIPSPIYPKASPSQQQASSGGPLSTIRGVL